MSACELCGGSLGDHGYGVCVPRPLRPAGMKTCTGEHWAILGPEDTEPEMFFRNEHWARAAVESEVSADMKPLIRMFRVRVSYEVIESGARSDDLEGGSERCSATVDGGRCAGLLGHSGEHYANARDRAGGSEPGGDR